MSQVVQFATTNQIILSEEERQAIIDRFPEKLKPFLSNVNNPLDETQILVNLFKDKNVRIIILNTIDEFGDNELVSYFHVGDIAGQIKYSSSDIDKWKSRWKIKFVSYEILVRQDVGAKIYEINKRRTDKNSNFISEQELKIALLKVKTEESNIFQDWILRQSTICKKILKYLVQIKHQKELEQEREKNAQLEKQLESHKLTEKEIMQLSLNAVKIFPNPERLSGYVYIATSPDYQKKYSYKIGLTTTKPIMRENSMQTSNPDIKIVFSIDTADVRLAEGYMHDYLRHLNYEKEFFYISSLDKAKELVTFVVNFVNECVGKYDGDNEILQKQYIDDNSKQSNKVELTPPQIRGRTRSPFMRGTCTSKSPQPKQQTDDQLDNNEHILAQSKKFGRPIKYATKEERHEAVKAHKREWRKNNAQAINEYKKTVFYPTHREEVLGYVHAYAKKQKELKNKSTSQTDENAD